VAYCLAKPGLALIQHHSWPALLQRPATWLTLLRLGRGLSHICFCPHVGMADTLILLISAFATVTVDRGHHRTLYVPGINSLFIMCIGIRNNSLVANGRWTRLGWGTNLGHWARHALLHMAAKWADHSATWAGAMHGPVSRYFIGWPGRDLMM